MIIPGQVTMSFSDVDNLRKTILNLTEEKNKLVIELNNSEKDKRVRLKTIHKELDFEYIRANLSKIVKLLDPNIRYDITYSFYRNRLIHDIFRTTDKEHCNIEYCNFEDIQNEVTAKFREDNKERILLLEKQNELHTEELFKIKEENKRKIESVLSNQELVVDKLKKEISILQEANKELLNQEVKDTTDYKQLYKEVSKSRLFKFLKAIHFL